MYSHGQESGLDRNPDPAGCYRPRSAQRSAADRQFGVEESLIKLGYADADDIMKAKAEQHGLPFVELREIEIPPSVIELVPESLARENIVMPLSQESGTIRVIMHDPLDFETIDKLRFVLNREIEVSLAPKEAIVEAINKYYGSATSETESVDSMLQEFTDTAIDFAEDGATGGKSSARPIPWKKATRRSSGWCT